MKVCGKVTSFAQGFQKLWKTQKVNSVNRNLTQNSRELNLTQSLHKLNKNLINTILTQNLQELNTGIRPTGTLCVPVGSKCPSDCLYTYRQAASCELGQAGLRAGRADKLQSREKNEGFVKFSLIFYCKLVNHDLTQF